MEKAVRAYEEVLRLIRKLPRDIRPYYSKYAREKFVNYREIKAGDLQELLSRTYKHCVWVLHKYSIEESVAGRLKEICRVLTRGRHHCRICGGVFCRACSKGRCLLPAKFRERNPHRVCDTCYDRLYPL